VGKVIEIAEDGGAIIEVRNRMEAGVDEIEIIRPKGEPLKIKIDKFIDMKSNKEVEVVNPNTIAKIYLDEKVEVMDMLRMLI
jgi:putative protease